MRLSKILLVLMVVPLFWACKANKTSANNKSGIKTTENDETAVKETYIRFLNALRKCDRAVIQRNMTPATWAAATNTRDKQGDIIDLMCKNIPKGNVEFEDITIDNNRATLSVKVGKQPPKDIKMTKINGKWLVGEPGRTPVLRKAPNAPAVNPVMIKHIMNRHYHYKVTNIHINPAVLPGSAKGQGKATGPGKQHNPVK